ncbi:MAG: hypothetical protein WC635_06830 [Bacteriovorax sp.]|jgi:hypothetical protein
MKAYIDGGPMTNDDPKIKQDDKALKSESNAEKLKFGGLTPLTAAQIVTLLVGATSSNSSYGGY